MQPHHPRERMREEPLCVAQEGAFALLVPQLLEVRKRDDLRVRKALYGFVAPVAVWVGMSVGVVDVRHKRTVRASSVRARRGVWLGWAISCSLWWEDYDGPLSISCPIHATHI